MNIPSFWDIAPRKLVISYRRFGGVYCLYLKNLRFLYTEVGSKTLLQIACN